MKIAARLPPPSILAGFLHVVIRISWPGMVGLSPKWLRLAPNGTNPGLFQMATNALKSDLKKSRICLIWGQSDPLWSQTYHLVARDVTVGL